MGDTEFDAIMRADPDLTRLLTSLEFELEWPWVADVNDALDRLSENGRCYFDEVAEARRNLAEVRRALAAGELTHASPRTTRDLLGRAVVNPVADLIDNARNQTQPTCSQWRPTVWETLVNQLVVLFDLEHLRQELTATVSLAVAFDGDNAHRGWLTHELPTRFTLSLVRDVANVITRHTYGSPT